MKSPMPVLVYAEATPNPDILKFVLNFSLLKESVEYLNSEEASESPLAAILFNNPDVKSVFIGYNFISITKQKEADWYELMPVLRATIQAFFKEGNTVIVQERKNEAAKADLKPIDNQIINIIEEYVQPAVAGDGGEIVYKSFEEGKVTLLMKGACRGCPSSTITLKSGIENLLKQMVPEVKEVVAEEF